MLGTILFILALPTAVLTVLVLIHMRGELRDRALLQNGLAAQVVARTVDTELRGIRRYLESVVAQPQLADAVRAGDVPGARTQLRWLVTQNGRISRAFITDPAGVELVDYPHDPSVIGKNFSHRDWYRGVSTTGSTYVSSFYRRAAFGQPTIVAIAVPIRDSGNRVLAYLVGQYTAADMMSWLWHARPSPDGWVGLVDAHGHYIRGEQPDADFHEVSDLEGLAAAMAIGAEWVVVRDPLRHQDIMISHTPIPSVGWTVVAAQPSAGVFAPLKSLLVTIALYFATCFVGAGTLGFLWYRTLRRYDLRRREVEWELRKAHATLEHRVADRTSKLAVANRELTRLASIVEFSSDSIIGLTLDGAIQSWNAGASRLYGHTEVEMRGKPFAQIAPPERQGECEAALQRVRHGTPVESLETVHLGRDGGRVDVAVSMSPILGEDGQPIAAALIARDVSQRKRTERRLKRTLDELAIKNRELQEFAYVASHDLQEPLRKIQAFGSRLRDRAGVALPATATDYLERMINAAERMQTLISDLLSFSRVATHNRPFEAVPLERIVREVMTDLEVRIEQTGGAIEMGPLPTIDGDQTQLRQLFQNLIGNALKFHRPGVPPRIRIQASAPVMERLGSEDGGEIEVVHIDVSDNGIGFEDAYRDRIFQPFQRLHGRGEYDGTGIGLAICRRIVERHSGMITAFGVQDEGARFRITLPVRQIPEGADECTTPAQGSSSSSPMTTSTIAS